MSDKSSSIPESKTVQQHLAIAYHRKRTQINEQTFQATTGLITFLSLLLLVIGLALAVLLYVLLFPV
ncbi:hypothetical protein ABIE27_002137 [Paenibacillus sp. 4624]|jgi:putative membrane protein|uniref:Uncharacterized protein n=1 Tax=Paenibacillus amylolyticus TaxID=1451 RepID=A0A5M9X131_PAEAM|nr:hypothetical protein [Paenibacillus amylolyticus]KAA8787482.1 hypothetical protein EC604_26980 [Paenibacillus amylolyticus]